MYRLRKKKKKEVYDGFDYVYESFSEFYKHSNMFIVKFTGKYNIAIVSSKPDEIIEFMENSHRYEHFNVVIYVEPTVVDVLSERYVNVIVDGNSSPYDDFLRIVNEKSLLIDRKLLNILYSSISHDINDMEAIVQSLVDTFGQQRLITEQMLSSKVILSKIVYPRQVAIEYLRMSKWRENKLEKCLEFMSNDVVLFSTINNVKAMIEQKAKFYTTGVKINKQLDSIWIDNLVLMYNIFVVERNDVKDVVLLYKLYERGMCPNDLLQ